MFRPLKVAVWTVICLWGAAGTVDAQIDISLAARHRKYLSFEPVEVRVRLRNYSGNTLIFGGETPENRGSLTFDIEGHSRVTVPCLDRGANLAEDLILEPMRTKDVTVMLNSLYDLQREDAYTVKVRIGHQRLANDYESDPITVEVQDGTTVATRRVGLPVTGDTTPIRTLTAKLLLFHDNVGALYCLRVEDDEFVYATVRLGDAVTTTPPSMDADAASAVHILFQTRPRLFQYSVYALAGKRVRMMQKRYYVPENSVPRLVRRVQNLRVRGGRPAVEGKDYRLAGKTGRIVTP